MLPILFTSRGKLREYQRRSVKLIRLRIQFCNKMRQGKFETLYVSRYSIATKREA